MVRFENDVSGGGNIGEGVVVRLLNIIMGELLSRRRLRCEK